MFISSHNGQLHIVNQFDHSIQAGQVTKHWGNDRFERPAHFDSVCLAVAKHDIGWVSPDREVLFNQEQAQPVNFINVNLRQHVEFYGSGFEQVKAEDAYAGLLVGMHWIGLYTSRFGYDPTFTYKTPDELRPFMQENIVKQQKDWIDLKMQLWSKDEPRSLFEDRLWMGYELVQVMDRLSQYVSLNTPDTTVEASIGRVRMNLDGPLVQLDVKGLGDGRVALDPFPFADEVETDVVLRKIPDIRYDSQAEARKVLEEAEFETITWRFVSAR